MADMFDFEGRTILDAGCGRADLARWLCREQVRYRQYLGIDAVPEMLQFAREQGIPNAEFRLLDFVADEHSFCAAAQRGAPDVVVFSGSLNTLPQEMALAVVDRAWSACRIGVVFNFLSVFDGADGEGPARKYSPVEMVRWALERTVLVAFRHDYLDGRDGTIVMRKTVE
jgi:SAM-dependent methyltransferase